MRRLVSVFLVALCSVSGAQDLTKRPGASVPEVGSATGALTAALARLRDAETAISLTAEGKALYEADANKRDGYEYCRQAGGLAERGEFREAIREASKALFLGIARRDDDVVAFAKRDLGRAYLYAGDLDRAQGYAAEALKHNARYNSRRAIHSVAHKILGDVALRRGDALKAIEIYKEAIDIADGSQRFFARAALAAAYIAAGQFDSARSAIDKADSFVGVVPGQLQSAANNSLLRLRGALALKQAKPDEAIHLFEAALAAPPGGMDSAYERFWVLDGLGRARIGQGDKAGALKAYMDAIRESEHIRSRFRSEEIKSGLFGEMQDVFGETIKLLMESGQPDLAWEISERGRARALLDLMRNRVMLAPGNTVHPDALSVPTRMADLASRLKPGEVVVSYHVLPRRTYGWAIRRSGVQANTIEVDRATLIEQVQEFRDAVIQRKAEAKELGEKLYKVLIKPFALSGNDAVAFIPHDALHYLPFQALWTGDQFMIQKVSISYAPSGGALAELARREPTKAGKLFALGNPDLGDPSTALPGAQREVEAIKAIFLESEVYFQKEATRERFMQRAGRSRLVHVAAHGSVDSIDPLHSRLYLAGTSGQSGTLEARDVYSMNLNGTALITLSACETGLGKVSRGDEIWGFTRSFLSAGAPALVASLWPVADESTELMMKRFYTELSKGADARRALRTAQIEVMNDARFSAAYFWAPFNLFGEWR